MSRPSRPLVGLPSGPGRARSASRSRQDDYRNDHVQDYGQTRSREPPSSYNSQSRSLRHQRSLASLPASRPPPSRPPPLPTQDLDWSQRSRRSASRNRRGSDDSSSIISSGTSVSTTSSSSYFDRRRGDGGYASSRTSLEEDAPAMKERPATSLRGRRMNLGNPSPSAYPQDKPDQPVNATEEGTVSMLWNSVATAASTLTVNVGKAWATNITTYAGEETPEGGESRLTKAMRAYHLAKAQNPTDLPDWLFEPHERRAPARNRADAGRPSEDDTFDVDDYYSTATTDDGSRSRGLRDIYAAAASVPRPSSRNDERRHQLASKEQTVTKAADRLKAMRDAKREALMRSTTSARTHAAQASADVGERENERGRRRVEDRIKDVSEVDGRRPRVGLPGGPGTLKRPGYF